MQAGGSAARAAVADLGEAVAASIRRASVLPTAALLVGALFADCHLPASSIAPPTEERQAGSKLAVPCNGAAYEVAANSVASSSVGSSVGGASSRGAAVPAVLAGLDWLAAELEERGAAVVRLPRHPASTASAGGSCTQEAAEERCMALLLHTAGMLADCCSIHRGGNSGGRRHARLRLEQGVQATLLQHSRLNQLLPWLATEGLLVAALLGSGVGAGGSLAAASTAAVSEREVLDSAAWLRCMLAQEVDTGERRRLVGHAMPANCCGVWRPSSGCRRRASRPSLNRWCATPLTLPSSLSPCSARPRRAAQPARLRVRLAPSAGLGRPGTAFPRQPAPGLQQHRRRRTSDSAAGSCPPGAAAGHLL